jgi:phosphate acyltransferase
VTIKFFEGLATFIFELWAEEFRAGLRGKIAYLLMRPGIGRIRRTFDYEVLGGSPLLGVRGTVVITHGRAKRRMVKHAIRVGAASARARLPELIGETFRRPVPAGAGGAVTEAAPETAIEGLAPAAAPPRETAG